MPKPTQNLVSQMKIFGAVCTFVVLAWLIASTSIPHAPAVQPCSPEWFTYLDSHYGNTSDAEGHGPDPGDAEWFNAFERQAKLPDSHDLSSNSQRCQLIQSELARRIYIVNQNLGFITSF
ncbi:hypothetical protein [Paraburkholderia antibiotica]|uniref:Uncharacterized protein n=1 Tax=Paraburkholderia antibiotica TaxID=2728839 RepID=A0A7Y0A2C1_9BURK|nr:hypothetical protein [Paraburkholderia antibiotica]NML35250.1 hypothetical protein [Paraburkholderia antibiotica]